MSDTARTSATSPFARTEPGRRSAGVPAEARQMALPRVAVLGGMTLGLAVLRRVAGTTAAMKVARFVNLGLTSLLAGNGIGALLAVHPALRELPAREYLEAEQGITRRYARIMSVLMPAAVASCINVLRLTRDRRSPTFGLTVAGTANLVGMMIVTGIELPLNRKTLETSPDDVSEWVVSRERWDRFNLIRNALTVNGWALLCLAALFEGKDQRRLSR